MVRRGVVDRKSLHFRWSRLRSSCEERGGGDVVASLTTDDAAAADTTNASRRELSCGLGVSRSRGLEAGTKAHLETAQPRDRATRLFRARQSGGLPAGRQTRRSRCRSWRKRRGRFVGLFV